MKNSCLYDILFAAEMNAERGLPDMLLAIHIGNARISLGVTDLAGERGLLFCAACVLPQWIFYSMAYGMILVYWFHWPQKQWNHVKTVFVILMFSVGIIVEIYVNPLLLKWVIRMM